MINTWSDGSGPPTRPDRGQGTLDYVGVLALAALLIITLLAAGLQLPLAEIVERSLCTITRQSNCQVGAGATPYERARSGRYLAMGDSFASGEGAWDYEEGTDFDDRDDPWPFNNDDEDHNRCRRSKHAYAQLLAAGNDFAGGSRFVACSGALIDDFYQPNHKETGEDPQLEALGRDVSLITLSVGGNNLGFADVLIDCVTSNLKAGLTGRCQEHQQGMIKERMPQVRADLVKLYQRLRRDAPNARIIVVGYPALFETQPDPSLRNVLSAPDQRWMNEVAAEFSATVAAAAHEAGVEYVDPAAAFRGHGIGSADPWFNDLIPKGPGAMLTDPSSFHPNAAGHAAFAALIQQQLEDPH